MSYEDTRSRINASFQESLSAVQASSERVQRQYVGPTVEKLHALSAAKPLTAVFLLIFSSLSLFPVLTFLGISTLTLISLLFVSIFLALFVSSIVILFLGACLFGLLIIFFFFSLFLTSILICGYLVARFITHFRNEPTPQRAVNAWFTELVKAVVARIPITVERIDHVPEGFDLDTVDPPSDGAQPQTHVENVSEAVADPRVGVSEVKSEEKA